jgi:hypothetical protein
MPVIHMRGPVRAPVSPRRADPSFSSGRFPRFLPCAHCGPRNEPVPVAPHSALRKAVLRPFVSANQRFVATLCSREGAAGRVAGMSYDPTKDTAYRTEWLMKHSVSLTTTSVLSILLTTAHMAADIVLRFAPGGYINLPMVFLLAVWLYATLALRDRRSGYILILILSLLSSGLPVIHTMGRSGLSGGAKSLGGFFFAMTLYSVGVTSIVSVLLSVGGLWSLRRARSLERGEGR